MAQALARVGTRVAIVSRHAVPGALSAAADLAEPGAVDRIVAWATAGLGGTPDALVNVAGAFTLARVEDTEPAVFDTIMALNVGAPFRLARALLPAMRARGHGDIVTVGSVADRIAFPENGAYAASKFAARGLHEVLREELRGSGVRATLVSPAAVDTALWDAIDLERHSGVPPRAAMLSADAVAEAIVFALTRPRGVAIDELRLSACTSI